MISNRSVANKVEATSVVKVGKRFMSLWYMGNMVNEVRQAGNYGKK
jgi:hypothetical protein